MNGLVLRHRWARRWTGALPWLRRYAPCEALSTFGAFGCAWLALTMTNSLAAAAVGGVVGGTVGFYAVPAVRAFRGFRAVSNGGRVVVALGMTTRSLLVEFGPAECVDSALLRPGLLYLGPMLLGTPFAGWLAGKVVADKVFYVITGWSLRRNRRLIEPVGA